MLRTSTLGATALAVLALALPGVVGAQAQDISGSTLVVYTPNEENLFRISLSLHI